MSYIWEQLRQAVPLIWSSNDFVLNVTIVTLKVAAVATVSAFVIGIGPALALGLGRFRGRRALQLLANASLALPPVLVGIIVLILLLPQSAFGSLRIIYTLRAVYVAQTILALPYIVALSASAIRSLPPGLLAQSRALGASRVQLSVLALREAHIGILAAVIAALASALSEVAAVIIVGGNIEGRDATLASSIVTQINNVYNIPEALALGIVLLVLIAILIGALTMLQRRGEVRLRWRGA